VGTLYQDPLVPARLMADDLFSKHFAIVGTTGCGKSSALTCILRGALKNRAHAHVLVLDMHGEYHRAFGAQAEVIGAGDLHLPFWLLNFQAALGADQPDDHHDAQVEILCDAIIVPRSAIQKPPWAGCAPAPWTVPPRPWTVPRPSACRT
jgi:hypothetical protein